MKITQNNLDKLRNDCVEFLSTRGLSVNDITNTRDAWTVFARANGCWLYNEGLNDAHIGTALKRIFNI